MFALWTWTGREPGPAPAGLGDTATLALAVPGGTRAQARAGSITLQVPPVDCALVDPAGLAGFTPADPGRSTRAWQALLAGEHADLPLAGHAVPNATGT